MRLLEHRHRRIEQLLRGGVGLGACPAADRVPRLGRERISSLATITSWVDGSWRISLSIASATWRMWRATTSSTWRW
jgi:hypothetical protein